MLKFLFRALLVVAVLVFAVWVIGSFFVGGADRPAGHGRPAAVEVKTVLPPAPSSLPPVAATESSAPPSGLPAQPIPYDQLKNGQPAAPPPTDQPQDKNNIFY